MVNLKCTVLVVLLGLFSVVTVVQAQIPALGACPLHCPIAKFNRSRFLGTWYEVERYFTVSEVATKCVSATYELQSDGKIVVKNALTNSFNNVERIISGILAPPGRAGDGHYTILYQSFSINYNATVLVLGTDYVSYAVLYSCSNIGPVGHTVSAWLMTRDRVPQANVMFRAYEVLNKYGISRTFFVKTNQVDCIIVPDPLDATRKSTAPHGGEYLAATRQSNLDELTQLRKEIFAMPNVDLQPYYVDEKNEK
ncbi:apolipoprotein D-like [Topomyia yanbarensis]|uniref:apolipoprotein D-like n=1 Tax=Topomyia yanbarensis TaxID=2498891 RepID=UPI00273B2831|nr:apolipoprotein D-like [Topomyia yanbarensis]